jgi:predicted  nucleic acid-binding Zn-ribbon protein
MNKAKQLYELQDIEFDIARKNETLAQVAGQIGKDDDLLTAREALSAAVKRLSDLEHQQRAAEWEVDELAKKIASEEKRLYGGSVKNPRELMSLQQETELLREKHRQQEEQVLGMMEEVDAAQQDVELKRAGVGSLETQWQEEQRQLTQEQTDLQTEVASLLQKRESLASQTDSTSLKAYQELRQGRGGLAVATVVQGRCQGCRMSLPMSDQQRARAGHELVRCSNCGRILLME